MTQKAKARSQDRGDIEKPLIALDGVTISFALPDRDYVAVRDINMSVKTGSFLTIIGPTGCGKTTILNAIAGLLRPASGNVQIGAAPLRGLNTRASYMFQRDSLLPWKTVLDNVALGLMCRGVGRQERTERAREWIARVGLVGFEDAYPSQLSGGMRKRASLAQVWIVEPDILLMDEPFAALDVQTRQLMENELLDLWSGSGTTVLFVTHDLDEAVALSDEVLLLSAGPASRIVGQYPIEIPRPRNLLDIRSTAAFSERHKTIWSDLRKEVMITYEKRFSRASG
ncbi:MAG: ABC transporter ATP-binding protein [Dongiaceae bacterium]